MVYTTVTYREESYNGGKDTSYLLKGTPEQIGESIGRMVENRLRAGQSGPVTLTPLPIGSVVNLDDR